MRWTKRTLLIISSQFAIISDVPFSGSRDPLGNVTRWGYDLLDRMTSQRLPDPNHGALPGPESTYSYDAVGNVLTETDPLSRTTTFQYDHLYRQTKVIQPALGGTAPETVTTYDPLGRRATLTDPVGNTTTWGYDLLDRVTSETNPQSAARGYAYDAVGNVTEMTDRNGRVTEYRYDHLQRLTTETWKDSGGSTVRTLSYGFDNYGRMASASDPAAAYSYAYDSLDRATSITQDLAGLRADVVFTQQYNCPGNRTRLSATIGTTADFTNDYVYDDLNRLARVEQWGEAGGNAVAPKRVDFAHDADGRMARIRRFAGLGGTHPVVDTSYAFDDAGRLTDLTHRKGATVLAGYAFSYDAASRLTQMVSSADGTSTYAYDTLDQLTSADHTSQTDESYAYDANGNRTSGGYQKDTNNRLKSDGTYTYAYDAEGNRTARFIDVNGSGQLDAGDTNVTEYAWDHRNRLVEGKRG